MKEGNIYLFRKLKYKSKLIIYDKRIKLKLYKKNHNWPLRLETIFCQKKSKIETILTIEWLFTFLIFPYLVEKIKI